MPALGADMEAGTLVEWIKHPGDSVRRGEIIAVVDTQKGAIEIEAFEDGVLERVMTEPGTEVPVGTVLAIIRAPGEAPSAEAPRSEPGPSRLRASPAARSRAAELRLDLTAVQGTGSQGAITLQDVERAVTTSGPPGRQAPADRKERTTSMRTAIATAMARSKREIPHYYLSTTIDMRAAVEWLREENERRQVAERLLTVSLMIKAVALGLREVPELNGFWNQGGFQPGPGIHVGCAISLRGGGLVAPALRVTDQKDLATLTRELRDLVIRARAGSLRSGEVSDPTITVTNLGEQGVESTFGIIYPPQVGLVGFGRVVERPWVVSGRIEPRPIVTATLSADHRVTDGHRGGQFLAAVERLLQSPQSL